VKRAHSKYLLMMKMTKNGIKRTLVKVRILGRFIGSSHSMQNAK